MLILKRQAAAIAAQQAAKASQAAPQDTAKRDPDTAMQDASPDANVKGADEGAAGNQSPANSQAHANAAETRPPADGTQHPIRQSWEYIEEVVQILKTAFPLLIMSMETIVEQISSRLKPGPDEETYRLMSMVMQDAIQVRISVHFTNMHFQLGR